MHLSQLRKVSLRLEGSRFYSNELNAPYSPVPAVCLAFYSSQPFPRSLSLFCEIWQEECERFAVANGSDGDLAVRVKGVARTPWKANRPGTFHHLYYLADDGCYKLDVLLGAQRKLAKNKKLGGDHAVKKMFYKCCSCGGKLAPLRKSR